MSIETTEAEAVTKFGKLQPTPFQYVTEPWDHQRKAVELAAPPEVTEFALFMDLGTGKTATLINILRHKFIYYRRIMRTIILAPLIVLENWKREWLMHSKLKPTEIEIFAKSAGRADKILRTRAPIIAINYDALVGVAVFDALKAFDAEVLVLDESHRCKSPQSKKAKRTAILADKTTHRYLLSGSPILNSPMDLFMQFKILDRGKTFGKNFFDFRNQYFWDRNAGMPSQKHFPDWRLKKGAEEAITARISAKSIVVKKSECLDLPDLVKETIYVELSDTQKRLYAEMKKDFIAFVDGGKMVVAQLGLEKMLRLMQIVSGYVTVQGEDGREDLELTDNPRAKALEELLEELTPNHKVIVWAVWRENYRTIEKVLKKVGCGYVVVHGEVKVEEKHAAVLRFQSDPTCRVYLGHPGAGGIGVNLTASDYSVYYSRTFSLEQDVQSEARNHRGGSEIHEKITRIDLVAKDTIDELILERLSAKQAMGTMILDPVIQKLREGAI